MSSAAPGRRAGRILMIVAWLAGLFLATRFFAHWQQRQENPNAEVASSHTGNAIEVRLQANRQGHFVASGTLNGQPVTFMLDTGATQVAIPETLAARLGLPNGAPITLSTANGRVEGYRSQLREVGLGEIHLANVSAVIMPGTGDDTVLLGMSVLRQLEFTQRGGTLLLRQNLTP